MISHKNHDNIYTLLDKYFRTYFYSEYLNKNKLKNS